MDGATQPRRLRNEVKQSRELLVDHPLMPLSRVSCIWPITLEIRLESCAGLKVFCKFKVVGDSMAANPTVSIRTLRLKVKRETYAASRQELSHRQRT
jgi:hypothetical protein